MALRKRLHIRTKSQQNTGFGSNAASYGGRFISKNGYANVRKSGVGFFDSISWYHTMLNIPRWKFMFIILLFYFLVNCFFAALYLFIGIEHLDGARVYTPWDKFGQAFFFSIQTLTTVGYGHISPTGFFASMVAAVEALFGLLSFAIATGLFYGRFSMPKAHILFSKEALIAPYKENQKALMIRLTPYKNANLTDVEARFTLGIQAQESRGSSNQFYNLELELDKINSLNLSWTLVHPITIDSPLYEFTEQDYAGIKGELIVFIKAFDDMFSNTVVKRTSYTFDEFVYGAKFEPMFSRNEDNTKTILHIDKLNAYQKVEL